MCNICRDHLSNIVATVETHPEMGAEGALQIVESILRVHHVFLQNVNQLWAASEVLKTNVVEENLEILETALLTCASLVSTARRRVEVATTGPKGERLLYAPHDSKKIETALKLLATSIRNGGETRGIVH